VAFGLDAYCSEATDTFASRPVCDRYEADQLDVGSQREIKPMPLGAKPPRIALLVTETICRAWLAAAKPDDILEYHRGVLAIDRLAHGSRLAYCEATELDRVANALWDLAQAGRGHLLQRRHGESDYSYLFVLARLRSSAKLTVVQGGRT
jgi:hypothetical protein